MSIDEFLDQYTPVELIKLDNRTPLKKFSDKMAVQYSIINRVAREVSPVESRSGSPRRRKY